MHRIPAIACKKSGIAGHFSRWVSCSHPGSLVVPSAPEVKAWSALAESYHTVELTESGLWDRLWSIVPGVAAQWHHIRRGYVLPDPR